MFNTESENVILQHAFVDNLFTPQVKIAPLQQPVKLERKQKHEKIKSIAEELLAWLFIASIITLSILFFSTLN